MLLLLSTAWALDVKVCAQTVTDFLDADVGTVQDYRENNGTRALRGTKVKLTDNVTQAVLTGRTAASGSSKGCADFTVQSGRAYTIRVVADVEIGGAELTVRAPNDGVWGKDVASAKVFFVNHTQVTYTVPTVDVWNVVAAGSFALHRENLGGAAFTKVYTKDSQGNWNSPCGGACIQGDSVWLPPTKARQQFAITYAMGWTHFEAIGGVNFDDTMSEPDYNGGFNDLHLLAAEYPSAAHAAGFAHLYSAVVYNDIEADCGMTYWVDANWDLLGTADGTGSCFREVETAAYHRFSCATGRRHVSPAYNQADYYTHMDPYTGTTALGTHFETALDVLRFWWDAMATYGLTYDEVVDAVTASDPSTWSSTGAVTYGSDLYVPGPMAVSDYDEASARHGIE